MPFSRARGKLGVDILKFQAWCFIDFWPLFVWSYRWHFCMFVQGQHIDTVNFVIWHCFQFDFSLTFDPLSIGRTKRSPWTLLHLRPRLTHWPFYFCHLTHLVIWPFFDLWSFNHRSDEEVTVDTYVCLPNTNALTLLLLSFGTFFNLPCFNLWPFILRSDKEVTVDTYACLPNTNTLTLICHLTRFVIWPFLTFDPLSVGRTKRSPWTLLHLRRRLTHWHCYFCHLTHFVMWPFFDLWPLNRRSNEEVTVDTYACLPNTTLWHCYLCHWKLFVIWLRFWPQWPQWPLIDLWLIPFVEVQSFLICMSYVSLLHNIGEVKHLSWKLPFWPLWPLHDLWGQTVDIVCSHSPTGHFDQVWSKSDQAWGRRNKLWEEKDEEEEIGGGGGGGKKPQDRNN